MPEIWKSVPGWPGYEVSDQGRVASTKRMSRRIKATSVHDDGHVSISLYRDGRPHHKRVHQLVALAFIGPVPDGQEVRHLDGNPLNNVPSNLAYGTSSQNNLDKLAHGTHNMARKTHCKRGHEFTPENTARIRLRTGSIARRCRKCSAIQAADRRASNRVAGGTVAA